MKRPIKLVDRLDLIKTIAKDSSVLHLGCTNWPYTRDAIDADMLLHTRLSETARELYGFDFDQEGIDILASQGFTNLFRVNLEELPAVELNKQFDVIIAGEMIEHLNNPGLFLEGIKRFMKPGGRLVLTTINAYAGMRFFVYGLRGRGGVVEPVHPDHVAYYSYATLKLLVERHGFQLSEFMFYDIGREHRPGNGRLRNLINDVCVRIAPQWADGVIAICSLD